MVSTTSRTLSNLTLVPGYLELLCVNLPHSPDSEKHENNYLCDEAIPPDGHARHPAAQPPGPDAAAAPAPDAAPDAAAAPAP